MTEKVFRYLLNEAAFIDTIALSVWTEEKPIQDQLLDSENVPILSRKSLYARRLSGKAQTGNPVDVLYGRVSRFPRVPPSRVVMRSEEVPLTGAQVNETMRSLFPTATRIQPVLVELTFDLKRVSVPKLQQQMIHRARQWQEQQDVDRRQTLYIGSPASPWQLRIYDKNKTRRIVRLELTLRQKFLSDYGIRQPDAIVRLRSLQLRQYFSLRKFSRSRVTLATKGWRDEYWRELALDWDFYRQPLQVLCRMLDGRGDKTQRLFPIDRRQQTLEMMQKNLVW